jgi:transcriptional regulator of acetoin/glycerol metabolism
VCGQPSVLRKAEQIHFVEGSVWDEGSAGTNAPGMALRLDGPVVINGAEHFTRQVQRWSCAAAPIHDPETQAILGIVDITGGPEVASPQTIAMVRATARMAESELARLVAVERMRAVSVPILRPDMATPGRGQLRLEALGRPEYAATLNGRAFRLSPRHSEIAVILSEHQDGLTVLSSRTD